MSNLDQILEDFKCQSKGDVVQMLVGLGSVEKLTNIKLELCEMCRKVEDFPQGEFYLR